MDILFIADFCGGLDGQGNNRFLYLANMLCKEHEVEILTSDFNHGKKAYFLDLNDLRLVFSKHPELRPEMLFLTHGCSA